ncbi:MAG: Stp1/IreP family PP2C-type Ser/Thr phosphatase [Actinomycetota bacterium]
MTGQLGWGASSDIGLVREINEDSKLIEPPVFAVADGMGGHSAGDVASGLAIESLSKTAVSQAGALPEAVREANRVIFEKASSDESLTGMGTTIIAMFAETDSAQIVHVGDCRAYLLRDGELSRLTQDHTVVERLVQEGKILPEDADRHPQRSYLERALGIDQDVDVEVKALDVSPSDRYLLCSDGLFGMIDDGEILKILKSEQDPQKAADRLCGRAVEAGGRDNVTAIVVDYPPSPVSFGQTKQSAAVSSPAPAPPRAAGNVEAGAGRQNEVPSTPRRASKGRGRRLGVWVMAGIIVLGAAGFAIAFTVRNSWYVGASRGKVAVFQGINGTVAGIQLSRAKEPSDLQLKQLPEHYQKSVQEGISAKDRPEALATLNNLRKLAQPTPSPTPAPDPIPTASPAPAAIAFPKIVASA